MGGNQRSRFAMKFLLFLILIRFHYAKSQCAEGEYPLMGSSCVNDEGCHSIKINGKTYKFNPAVVRCKDQASCCFLNSVCKAEDDSSTPLKNVSHQDAPILCHENSQCENARKALKEAQAQVCVQNVCCSQKVAPPDTTCPMDKTPVSTQSCSLTTDLCKDHEYCDERGCCPRHYCKGSHMLPMTASKGRRIDLRSCSSHLECTVPGLYNDSYCSPLETKTDEKFCCAVPHSLQFLELKPPAYLFPTGILDLHSKTMGDARLGELDNRPEEFSKKCTKNSDCGEEEFCDQVTIRYPENQTKIKAVKDYFPKACFPAPRCAGKTYRDKDGTGVKFCQLKADDCPPNTFCDTVSNQNNEVIAFRNLGFCCQ
ncbi:hypothetical protein GCK32_012843, partial [Trichostrongylus colubriformis]